MNDAPLYDDFWVFAYGSLMWNPGFPHTEVVPGQIEGYHRSLCVLSTIYRGTPEKPGLVLGLNEGGSCCGLAFRVAPEHVNDTIVYLDEREQVTKVYCPQFFDTRLNDGRTVKSYTFVVRRDHEQFAGDLSLERQAELVRQGVGQAGTAVEYLSNTIAHIDELGLHDAELHEVLKIVDSFSVSSTPR